MPPEDVRPAYPTNGMVRILIIKQLYNPSDEQLECQLLDRMSYQRFCGLRNSKTIPDRTTIWKFENRIREVGAKTVFQALEQQLLKHGFIAQCG